MTLMSIAKKIVPIAATGAGILFARPAPNWGNIHETLDSTDKQKYQKALRIFVKGMTGISIPGPAQTASPSFDVMETLNPFDLKYAPYTKIALWSSLSMEAISKIGALVRKVFDELA